MQRSKDHREAAFTEELPEREVKRVGYDVISPGPGEEVRALVLSDRPLITRSHFQNRKSYACVGVENGCPFCVHHVPRRWKGYLAGMDLIKGRLVLVELTDNALYETPLIAKSKASLRGKVIHLKRQGEKNNGRVICYFSDDPQRRSQKGLRPAFDVREAVLNLWAVDTWTVDVSTGEVVHHDTDKYFPEQEAREQPEEDEPEIPEQRRTRR